MVLILVGVIIGIIIGNDKARASALKFIQGKKKTPPTDPPTTSH